MLVENPIGGIITLKPVIEGIKNLRMELIKQE